MGWLFSDEIDDAVDRLLDLELERLCGEIAVIDRKLDRPWTRVMPRRREALFSARSSVLAELDRVKRMMAADAELRARFRPRG